MKPTYYRQKNLHHELVMMTPVDGDAVPRERLYANRSGGSGIRLVTRGIFHQWLEFFEEGIRWSTETFVSTRSANILRRAPVAGALAFAHKTNPKKIEEFGVKLRDGIGLVAGEPAWALRRALVDGQLASMKKVSDSAAELSRKTLRAAHAHITGDKLTKLQTGDVGLSYFQKAYADSRKLKQLARPFYEADATVAREAVGSGDGGGEVDEMKTGTK